LQLGLALGAILKASSEPATALFLSIKTSRAQRDALESVARILLMDEDLRDYDALISACASVEKQRNALAHGIFGISDQIPDGLLWSDLQDHANFLIRAYQAEYEGKMLADPHAQLREDMFIYRKKDLEKLVADLREVQKAAFFFHCQHQPRTPKIRNYRPDFRALSLIKQELARMPDVVGPP
jgi:hypothetical protein